MVGVNNGYLGSIDANSIYQEFKYYGTGGKIYQRNGLGAYVTATDIIVSDGVQTIYNVTNAMPVDARVSIANNLYGYAITQANPISGQIYKECWGLDKFLLFTQSDPSDVDKAYTIEYIDASQAHNRYPIPSGNIKIETITTGSDVAMSKYYRSSLTYNPPGIVPINDYNTRVGEMLLDNKYTDYYSARRNPTVIDSRTVCSSQPSTTIPWSAYLEGASVYIRAKSSSYLYVSKVWINGTNVGTINKTLWSPSTMYDTRSGFLKYCDSGYFVLGSRSVFGVTRTLYGQVELNPLPQAGTQNGTKYQVRVKIGFAANAMYTILNWTDIPLWESGAPPYLDNTPFNPS